MLQSQQINIIKLLSDTEYYNQTKEEQWKKIVAVIRQKNAMPRNIKTSVTGLAELKVR